MTYVAIFSAFVMLYLELDGIFRSWYTMVHVVSGSEINDWVYLLLRSDNYQVYKQWVQLESIMIVYFFIRVKNVKTLNTLSSCFTYGGCVLRIGLILGCNYWSLVYIYVFCTMKFQWKFRLICKKLILAKNLVFDRIILITHHKYLWKR